MTERSKPNKKITELSQNEIKILIESRKRSLNQLKQGSISYIVAKSTVQRLEKELERRKNLQSRQLSNR